MSVAYLDTHVAIYLADGMVDEFSKEAKRQIEANDLLISPMVYIEFDYMYRRERISMPAKKLFNILNTDFGVQQCQIPFARVAAEAVDFRWTDDPFDRIITAQAMANHNASLITKDRNIRKHYKAAAW